MASRRSFLQALGLAPVAFALPFKRPVEQVVAPAIDPVAQSAAAILDIKRDREDLFEELFFPKKIVNPHAVVKANLGVVSTS